MAGQFLLYCQNFLICYYKKKIIKTTKKELFPFPLFQNWTLKKISLDLKAFCVKHFALWYVPQSKDIATQSKYNGLISNWFTQKALQSRLLFFSVQFRKLEKRNGKSSFLVVIRFFYDDISENFEKITKKLSRHDFE